VTTSFRHRRVAAAIALVATIALGLLSRRVRVGVYVWDKSLGDALYTVMIHLLLVELRPRAAPWSVGAVALVTSFAIELFQLTEIPLRLPPLVRFALGTEFSWHDMGCYVVGALAAVAVDTAFLAIRITPRPEDATELNRE
jgi:hypothetical protein